MADRRRRRSTLHPTFPKTANYAAKKLLPSMTLAAAVAAVAAVAADKVADALKENSMAAVAGLVGPAVAVV